MISIKKKQGSALVVVIIVMVVTSILITAVLTLNLSDNKNSIYWEKRAQAQYIARAGADAAAEYVEDNHAIFEAADFVSMRFPNSDTDPMGEGTFFAEIRRAVPGTVSVVVESTGFISEGTEGEISETVTVSLVKGDYSSLFTGIRQTGGSDLDAGAIGIGYEDDDSIVKIEGNVLDENADIILADNYPNPPDLPNSEDTDHILREINNDTLDSAVPPSGYEGWPDNITEGIDSDGKRTWTIAENFYRDGSLDEVTGNYDRLIFDTGDGSDLYVVVNDIDLQNSQGKILIIGGGVVHLFIMESGSIWTPMDINESDPSQLFIYVDEGATLELQANCVLNAYIYAPEATIQVNSSSTTVNGAMIGDIFFRNVSGSGAQMMFNYVPLGDNTDFDIIKRYVRKNYSN